MERTCSATEGSGGLGGVGVGGLGGMGADCVGREGVLDNGELKKKILVTSSLNHSAMQTNQRG